MTEPSKVGSQRPTTDKAPETNRTSGEKPRGNRAQGKGKSVRSKQGGTRSGGDPQFTKRMKGNVFQCHQETTNTQQFQRNLGVLEELINKTFIFPQIIKILYQCVRLMKQQHWSNQQQSQQLSTAKIWARG
jgi:hypothetical protein